MKTAVLLFFFLILGMVASVLIFNSISRTHEQGMAVVTILAVVASFVALVTLWQRKEYQS